MKLILEISLHTKNFFVICFNYCIRDVIIKMRIKIYIMLLNIYL